MKKKASKLDFISEIAPDGTGVDLVTSARNKQLQNSDIDNELYLTGLSISERTYIASGFGTYVVKINESKQK